MHSIAIFRSKDPRLPGDHRASYRVRRRAEKSEAHPMDSGKRRSASLGKGSLGEMGWGSIS